MTVKSILIFFSIVCRSVFYAFKTFLNHLNEHTNSSITTKCIKCNLRTTKDTILKHLVNCHGFGLYQCIFCRFGTTAYETIKLHIANKHSSKLPFFCQRASKNEQECVASSIESTSLQSISQKVDSRCIRRAVFKELALKNLMNMKMLDSNILQTPNQGNHAGNFIVHQPCIQKLNMQQAKSSGGDKKLEIEQKVAARQTMNSALVMQLTSAKLQQKPQTLVKDPPKIEKHFIQKPIQISQAPAIPKPLGLQIQSVFSLQGMFSQNQNKNPKMQMLLQGTNRQRLLLPKPENNASD